MVLGHMSGSREPPVVALAPESEGSALHEEGQRREPLSFQVRGKGVNPLLQIQKPADVFQLGEHSGPQRGWVADAFASKLGEVNDSWSDLVADVGEDANSLVAGKTPEHLMESIAALGTLANGGGTGEAGVGKGEAVNGAAGKTAPRGGGWQRLLLGSALELGPRARDVLEGSLFGRVLGRFGRPILTVPAITAREIQMETLHNVAKALQQTKQHAHLLKEYHVGNPAFVEQIGMTQYYGLYHGYSVRLVGETSSTGRLLLEVTGSFTDVPWDQPVKSVTRKIPLPIGSNTPKQLAHHIATVLKDLPKAALPD